MISFEIKKCWRNKTFLKILVFVIVCLIITSYQAIVGSHVLVQETMTNFSDIHMKYLPTSPLIGQKNQIFQQLEESGQDQLLKEFRHLCSLYEQGESLLQPYYSSSNFDKGARYAQTMRAYILSQRNFYDAYGQFVERHPDFFSFDNPAYKENLQWRQYLFHYLADQQGHVSSPYLYIGGHYDSTVQNIIYYAPLYLGLPALIFFYLLFYSQQSEEKQRGTIQLLQTQPVSSFQQVAAKLVAGLFCLLFYLLFLLAGLTVVFSLTGVPLGGWHDAFRLFTESSEPHMILAGSLLLQLCFSFASLVFLGMAFSLLLGNFLKTSSILAISFISLFLLFMGTSMLPVLQSVWNPLYLTNGMKIITGSIDYIEDAVHFGWGIRPYIGMILAGLIFFLLSAFTDRSTLSFSHILLKAKGRGVKKHSCFYIECKKIFISERVWIYFAGLMAGLILLFLNLQQEKRNALALMQEGNGWSDVYLEEIKQLEKQMQVDDPDAVKTDTVEGTEELSNVDSPYQFMLNVYREKYDHAKQIEEAYRAGDGPGYYQGWIQKLSEEDRVSFFQSTGYSKGANSELSIKDSQRVFQEAQKQGEAPILFSYFLFSPREEYTGFLNRWNVQKALSIPEDGAFFWLYDLLQVRKMDLVLFLALIFMVFTGYTIENRRGTPLHINYTMPLSRGRFHLRKWMVSFLLAVGIVLTLLLFAFLLALITGGPGSVSFPVLAFRGKTVTTMPIGRFLVQSFLVIIHWLAFLSAFSLFLSIFIQRKEPLLLVVLGTIALGIFLNRVLGPVGKLFNPFSYLETSALVDGSMYYYQAFTATVSQAMLILGVWTLFFLLLGEAIVTRREMQNAY